MSPGEYAKRGEGLTIFAGWCDSPFGACYVAATDRGVCGLAFGDECGRAHAEADMKSRWPKAHIISDDAYISEYFQGLSTLSGALPLHLIGSPLQIKVWQALLEVPSGSITTYSEIAGYIDRPKAVRAVGTAVGRNPISWLIPCHRALRKSGALGGYHWGLPVKRALLAWESARRDAD